MFTLNKKNLQEKILKAKFIIIDEKVLKHHNFLNELIQSKTVFIICGKPEDSKNLDTFGEILNFFLDANITRKDTLIAIGGGAVSDLAGYVASSLLRGIEWEVYPTTFLAMIDASIGGKVGINTTQGKNLVGAFHKPCGINIYLPFLESLEACDYNSGMGELLKYYFLSKKISQLKMNDLDLVIESCINYKNTIVEADFREGGRRKILNFGHTFGHVIEKISHRPHGVCVFLGIEMLINFLQPELKKDLERISSSLNIKFTLLEKMNFDQFFSFLEMDKKRVGDSIEFIKIKSIGCSYIESIKLDELKSSMRKNENYKNYFE